MKNLRFGLSTEIANIPVVNQNSRRFMEAGFYEWTNEHIV